MKYIKLPGTDIECSAVCYGPAGFGTDVTAEDSFKLLDQYAELGGTILDTAHVYANWLNKGDSMSEKTIGNWMTSRGMHKKMTVATKGGHFDLKIPKVSRVTRQEVYTDIQESLEYLQTDCLDIFWLHRDNPEMPAGEIVEFLNEFYKKGLIRNFGGSNWNVSRLREASSYAEEKGLQAFTSTQNLWCLAELSSPMGDTTLVACEKEDLDYYRQTNHALFAYTSQAQGFFGIYDEKGEAGLQGHTKAMFLNDANLSRLEYIKKLCVKYNCQANDIALAYMTSQDFCCVPVFGSTNVKHMDQNMKAGDLTLTREEVEQLFLNKAY